MDINPDYRLVYDENNVIHEYHEIRERKKKDGQVEEYEYTERTFYPTVKVALQVYLQKQIKGLSSAEAILKRIDDVEKQIQALPIDKKPETINV